MHLADLLVETFEDRNMRWLFKQLMQETSLAIETLQHKRSWSDNPIDGVGMVCLDTEALDHVVEGKGARDKFVRATFSRHHVRSFVACSRGRLRVRRSLMNVNIASHECFMLHRYLSVGRRVLGSCNHLSVACDGTRLGGRELYMYIVSGRTTSGTYLTMWAPPQAH